MESKNKNKSAADILFTCTSEYSIREIDRTTQKGKKKRRRKRLSDRKFRLALCQDKTRIESGYPSEFNVQSWAYTIADIFQCYTRNYSYKLREYFHDYCSKFVIEISDEYDCRPHTEYLKTLSFPILSTIDQDISAKTETIINN